MAKARNNSAKNSTAASSKKAISAAALKHKVTQGTICIIIGLFIVLPLAWNATTLVNVIWDSCWLRAPTQDGNERNSRKTTSSDNAVKIHYGRRLENPNLTSNVGVKINPELDTADVVATQENQNTTYEVVTPDIQQTTSDTTTSVNAHGQSMQFDVTDSASQYLGSMTERGRSSPNPNNQSPNEPHPLIEEKRECIHGTTIFFSVGLFMLHTLFIMFAACYSNRNSVCGITPCWGKAVRKKIISNQNAVDMTLISAIFDHSKTEHIKLETESQIFTEIESLVEGTWVYKKTKRVGRDAACMQHKSITVKNVLKISNTKLWKTYHREKLMMPEHSKCEELLDKPILTDIQMQKIPPQCEINIPDTTNVVIDVENEKESMSLLNTHKSTPESSKSTLAAEEVYLFHGTKIENVPGLIENGFDLTKYSKVGLYGRAIYLAESSEKADQYADRPKQRRVSNLTMLVVRVTLGRISCHTDKEKPPKPPYRGVMGMRNQHGYDSIVTATNKRFREFLVFDPRQCYPEFVVIYDRI